MFCTNKNIFNLKLRLIVIVLRAKLEGDRVRKFVHKSGNGRDGRIRGAAKKDSKLFVSHIFPKKKTDSTH